MDTSGGIHGVNAYEDGSTTSLTQCYFPEQQVDGSMLNDEPLRIGLDPFTGGGFSNGQGALFDGEIGFIEIWNEELPPDYSASRWNDGQPARVPKPAALGLLVFGGAAALLRKRRA